MYEPRRPEPGPGEEPPDADGVIAWLKGGEETERALQASLDAPPAERDVLLARMGDVLQAAAQGLGHEAAAVWAGVPEHVLRGWLDTDAAFAAALHAARALATAHGARRGRRHTPAMVRVLLTAMSRGTTRRDAVRTAGFGEHRFRALLTGSSTLRSLLAAARRVRPPKPRSTYVPGTYRPRRPDRKPPVQGRFRLVQREAADAGEAGR
ncbi:hypothetical protein [Streptomyces sp. NPDC094032]|uniref:hypothetical protein n=1 Tax=Streptomyces sp. NPDC094032 TaxID=3155308 RepID=UPI0033347F4D